MAIKSKARHDLTLRSIKREITAGRDVAYWLDKAYSHLDNCQVRLLFLMQKKSKLKALEQMLMY